MAMPPAQEPELPPEEPKSGKAPIIIAVLVAIALGLGGGALWAARSGDDVPPPTESPTVTDSPTVSPTTQAPTSAPTTLAPTTGAPTTQAPTTQAPTANSPTATSVKPSKSPKPTDTMTGPPLEDEVEPTEAPPSAVPGEGDFETGGAP